MKQCHRFLRSWQDTELVAGLIHKILENEIPRYHVLQNILRYVVSWFHTSDASVYSSDPRFTCLSDAYAEVFFIKNYLLKV